MYSSSAPSPTRTTLSGWTSSMTSSSCDTSARSERYPTFSSPQMRATLASCPASWSSRQVLTAAYSAFRSESSGSAIPKAVAASRQFWTPMTGVLTLPFTPKSSSLSTTRTRVLFIGWVSARGV